MLARREAQSAARDVYSWSATAGAVEGRAGPLVVTLTSADRGAFLHDGSSVRRQLACAARLLRQEGREDGVVLSPAAWLQLAADDDPAARLEAFLGDELAAVPAAAIVFGVRFASSLDALCAFADGRIHWLGARSRRPWLNPPEAAAEHICELPALGACLVLNDHQLLALARTQGSTVLDAARRAGARHILHAAYAGSPIWTDPLARVSRELGATGWASAGRLTLDAGSSRSQAEGLTHLPLTLRLS